YLMALIQGQIDQTANYEIYHAHIMNVIQSMTNRLKKSTKLFRTIKIVLIIESMKYTHLCIKISIFGAYSVIERFKHELRVNTYDKSKYAYMKSSLMEVFKNLLDSAKNYFRGWYMIANDTVKKVQVFPAKYKQTNAKET
ncbi:hypothetical protein GJ496_006007, partial [Pomphorhynchus laevis]